MENNLWKNIFVILLLVCYSSFTYGQRPALKLDSYKHWPEVSGGGLSDNGKFIFYSINNQSTLGRQLIIKTKEGKEIASRYNISKPKFSADSKFFVGILENDTLLVLNLLSRKETKYANITTYDLVYDQKQEVLLTLSIAKKMNLYRLGSNDALLTLDNVFKFNSSKDGHKVVIEQKDESSQEVVSSIVDIYHKNKRLVHRGAEMKNIIFDEDGQQMAFMTTQDDKNNIFYYNDTLRAATLLLDASSLGIDSMKSITTGDHWSFSRDGKRLFFAIKNAGNAEKEQDDDLGLEIWNYKDAYLKSFYEGSAGEEIKNRNYLATVTISNRKVLQLLSGNQKLLWNTLNVATDSTFIVEESNGLMTEVWNSNAKASYYLCNSITGQQTPIVKEMEDRILSYRLSPTGKYFVYFNPVSKSYHCFDATTRTDRKIGKDIPDFLGRVYKDNYPNSLDEVGGISLWLPNDKFILQTAYDLWEVDPRGNSPSICVTKKHGINNKVVFFVYERNVGTFEGQEILLSAFDTRTKAFGFYNLELGGKRKLNLLSMGARYAGSIKDIYTRLDETDFLQSRDGYLIRWQGPDEAPNYFYSRHLKSFTRLSNVQPQRNFNWLTSELYSYSGINGEAYQGALLKPENFDPKRKYPIVFSIYEIKSNSLNAFISPELSGININNAVLASNGYLVFTPDIKGVVGEPGKAALQSVTAAVDHLKANGWVDTTKMAVMGHSFGGFETNYIISHSKIFAAAISSAGISSMILEANNLWESGENKQHFEQFGPTMMGKPLAEDARAYIENSPLLNATDIDSPVLFMHNDADPNVTFHQTRALFSVLRSLEKPCWWLNYKGMGHGVGGEQRQLDFNTKVFEFLNHYLKGQPMPNWMTQHN